MTFHATRAAACIPVGAVDDCFRPGILARHPWLGAGAGSPVVHGGPLLLAGVASGDGRALRVRGGWEVAAPAWLVLSAAVDMDLSSLATLAATAEATTQAWVLPLSFGAGLGPIVQVEPEVLAGGRAQVSAALGPARAVLSLDALGSADDGLSLSVAVLAGLSI